MRTIRRSTDQIYAFSITSYTIFINDAIITISNVNPPAVSSSGSYVIVRNIIK